MEFTEFKKEIVHISRRVVIKAAPEIKTIGGVYVIGDDKLLVAAVVVCDYNSLEVKEVQTYVLRNPLPHIVNYDALRVIPAMIEAYNLLENEPDLLLVQGVGVAHPKGCGVASHLGVLLNVPTIGVSERLVGEVKVGKVYYEGRLVGVEFKTRDHANPVIVTVGHFVEVSDLKGILEKVVCYPHKLPEPLYLARKKAKKLFLQEKV